MLAILHECNLFIAIYKTAFEHLQDLNNTTEIRIILNSQIRLFLEEGADCRRNNLLIVDKAAIIILDKYDRASFRDIVFVFQRSENNTSIFQNINSIIAVYMSLYYVLFFLYGDLR